MFCQTHEELSCSRSKNITLLNYDACLRKNFIITYLITTNTLHFSPCSGLVVSSYSKNLPDKSFISQYSQSIDMYKKYKQMYIVDETTDTYSGINKVSKLHFI